MSQAQVRDCQLQHCVTSLVSLQHQVLPALLSSLLPPWPLESPCRGLL